MVPDIDTALEEALAELQGDNPDEGAAEQPEEEPQEPEAVEAEGEQAEDEGEEPEADESEDAEDEEAPPESARIELTEDDVIVLPDGTEVAVKDATLLQSAFTKKTQELADQRRELEERSTEVEDRYNQVAEWYQERSANPADWVTEIVSGTNNPTLTVAKALNALATAGKLDPQFVEVFGIETGAVADVAKRGQDDDRVRQLESRLNEREQAEQQAARIAELRQQYLDQWRDTVKSEQLSFETRDAERDLLTKVVEYAQENDIFNLGVAYRAYAYANRQASPDPAKPDPATARKKRASKAISGRSAGSPQPAAKTFSADEKGTEAAAAESLEELLAGRG